jgi:hypothetical protein
MRPSQRKQVVPCNQLTYQDIELSEVPAFFCHLIFSFSHCTLSPTTHALAHFTAFNMFTRHQLDFCCVCASRGDEYSLLHCVDCGESFHEYCLEAPISLPDHLRSLWRCPDCKLCEGCRKGTAILVAMAVRRFGSRSQARTRSNCSCATTATWACTRTASSIRCRTFRRDGGSATTALAARGPHSLLSTIHEYAEDIMFFFFW